MLEREAKFCSVGLNDFFLTTYMKDPEYTRMHIGFTPDDIIEQYNLMNLVDDDGYLYIEICKGMYGLKQAALLAYQ